MEIIFKVGDIVKFNPECNFVWGNFKPDFNKSYEISSISNEHPFFISLKGINVYVFDKERFILDILYYRKEKINKIKENIKKTCK